MAESFTKAFFFIQIYGKNISHSAKQEKDEVLHSAEEPMFSLW